MSVARHTLYNFVGAIVPVAVALVTTPLYLKAIGLERFGVLSLVWVLTGYFTFFDLGLGRAISQRIASLLRSSADERNRTFWSGVMMSAVLSIFAVIIFRPVAETVLGTTQMASPLRTELLEGIPLLLLALPVGIFQSLLSGSLEGRRAFGPINLVGIVGNLLTGMSPLVSAWVFGPRISLLIAATLIARLMVLATQGALCRRIVPVESPALLPKEGIVRLLRFGGWTAVSAIVGPVLVYFDRFAIGALLGSAAVAYYVIAYNLITQLQAFPNSLVKALFPRLAELGPRGSLAPSLDAIAVVAAMATSTVVLAILLVEPFFRLWIGADVAARSSPIAIVLLVGFWTNAIAFVPFARLHSMGRPDQGAKVHLCELLPYLVALWFATTQFGLVGAALVWTVRCAIDLAAMLVLSGTAGRHLTKLALPFLLILATSVVGFMDIEGIGRWLVLALFSSVSMIVSWWVLPMHLRETALEFARRFRRTSSAAGR